MGPKGLRNLVECQPQYSNQVIFSISRSPNTPVDEALTDFDRRYMRLFSPTKYSSLDGNFLKVSIVAVTVEWSEHRPEFIIPTFSFSSKAYRFAYLAFAAKIYGRIIIPAVLEYIGKFYRYINNAIQSSSFLEVLTASFMALMFERFRTILHRRSFRSICIYFKGICCAGAPILSGPKALPTSSNDALCVYFLFLIGVHTLERMYFIYQLQYSDDTLQNVDEVAECLISWYNLVPRFSDIHTNHLVNHLSMVKSCLEIELDILLIYRKQSRLDPEKCPAVYPGNQRLTTFLNYLNTLFHEYPKGQEVLAMVEDDSFPPPWTSNSSPFYSWTPVTYALTLELF